MFSLLKILNLNFNYLKVELQKLALEEISIFFKMYKIK